MSTLLIFPEGEEIWTTAGSRKMLAKHYKFHITEWLSKRCKVYHLSAK